MFDEVKPEPEDAARAGPDALDSERGLELEPAARTRIKTQLLIRMRRLKNQCAQEAATSIETADRVKMPLSM